MCVVVQRVDLPRHAGGHIDQWHRRRPKFIPAQARVRQVLVVPGTALTTVPTVCPRALQVDLRKLLLAIPGATRLLRIRDRRLLPAHGPEIRHVQAAAAAWRVGIEFAQCRRASELAALYVTGDCVSDGHDYGPDGV